ncbi:hypothetical protein NQZ68_020958 [Dissostichus eleginoides]|nr:hypothetical protein NQZ68_020958 [Dissostichus eleginoides]
MNLFLLGVALGLAGASPLEDFKVCQPHSRPWQVYLHGGGVSCSGALIDPWWIVTSFGCIKYYTSNYSYEPAQHLKCITVPVVDDQTCMNTFPEFLFWSLGMVCAGRANTDNCMRDRGSVMVCDGRLQGVQWFSHGCSNHDDPSVYTKLCLYNDWINDVMDRYEPTLPTLPTETTAGMTTAEGQ